MTLWAIAYTIDSRGRPRDEPYVFSDTIARNRREAWTIFNHGIEPPILAKQIRAFGAKAIKVKIEAVR